MRRVGISGSVAACVAAAIAVLLTAPFAVAGVVGTGTPASCTQSALATQIAAGGTVTFDCGGAATIFTNLNVAATNPAVVVDGGGLITLDGSAANFPIFWINGSAGALPDVTFQNITFANGSYTTGLVAGGAIVNLGNTTLANVTLANNHAAFGGAIVQEACVGCLAPSLTVTGCTFSNNVATNSGGAINVGGGTLTVAGSTFAGNVGNNAGGAIDLYLNGGQANTVALISGSTFSGNSTVGSGGAIYQQGSLGAGGGVTIVNCTFTGNSTTSASATSAAAVALSTNGSMSSVTVAGNSAPNGAALYAESAAVVRNTIVAGNTGANCSFSGALGAGSLFDLQFGDATCTGFAAGNPLLGALANNGGPTLTMVPGAGSAAVDAIPLNSCTEAVDQRGLPRPSPAGGSCDIGAVEVQQTGTFTLAVAKAAPANVVSGQNLTYTITYGNSGTLAAPNVVIRDTLPAGSTFVSATGGGAVQGGDVVWTIGTVPAGATGLTVSFTVTVTLASGTLTNSTYSIQSGSQPPVSGSSVSTTVAAAPPGTAVPALGTAGLALLVLALGAAGVLAARRQA